MFSRRIRLVCLVILAFALAGWWCVVRISEELRDEGRGDWKTGAFLKVLRVKYAVDQRILGREHEDTLWSHKVLASHLYHHGQFAKAEKEYRALLAIRKPASDLALLDNSWDRSVLAQALEAQGKIAEAERELRTMLAEEARVRGAEGDETLGSREWFAEFLARQGRNAEAEAEFRAVLAIRERVPRWKGELYLRDWKGLAFCLEAQGKWEEALDFIQRAEGGYRKIYGTESDSSTLARVTSHRERIEGKLKEKEAGAGGN